MMHVGCHVSIKHGYLNAAKLAKQIGAAAFQFFSKNPRGLSVKSFDPKDAKACADYCREQGMQSIIHSPYPVNLAASSEEAADRVVACLRNDLEIAEACGSIGVVVHFGVYKGNDPLQGYQNIIQCLNRVIDGWEGRSRLLLENQAGDHSAFGMTFEELTQIRKLASHPERIGFCLDTCHLFASGIWNGDNWAEIKAKGDQTGYFDHLLAVHLNDSMYPSGSRRDRHASIGHGYIGLASIQASLRSFAAMSMPVILETPLLQGRSHREEIQFVKQLCISPGKE